jgi:tRNA(Arg) A34 adenosine deaminase TadA
MQNYMSIALEEARAFAVTGEIPVGALIVHNGEIIARSGNRTEQDHDPTAHAELLVIKEAARKLGTPRLVECDLYVSLEPCAMCAAGISFARILRLYFGAYDPKGGGVDHGAKFFNQPTCHHKPEVYGGIDEQACGEILKQFFLERR